MYSRYTLHCNNVNVNHITVRHRVVKHLYCSLDAATTHVLHSTAEAYVCSTPAFTNTDDLTILTLLTAVTM